MNKKLYSMKLEYCTRNKKDIRNLYTYAGHWFERNGYLDFYWGYPPSKKIITVRKKSNNELVGIFEFSPGKNYTFLDFAYIKSKYRNKGFFRQFLRKFKNEKIRWGASVKNKEAIDAYIHCGASIESEDKQYVNFCYYYQGDI
jgi:GNAT superfamily N-acetyltransferase